MLGLGGYGSGSDSDSENEQRTARIQSLQPTSSRPTPSTLSSSLPPPKTKKKVGIALPSLKSVRGDDEDDAPPAKKARLESGAGVSSLLSMLPAPKQKTDSKPRPTRVLGGGAGGQSLVAPPAACDETDLSSSDAIDSLPFLPPSLKKGRSNISLEEDRPRMVKRSAPTAAPAVDFFGLGTPTQSSPSTSPSPSLPATSATPSASSVKLSSAPSIPVFEIPEPQPTDEYPGYYQLHSGKWAQHDTEYYNTFVKKWQREYNAHVRALEKGAGKGFENLERSEVADVDAAEEMERAKHEIKEREERKALSMGTDGEPAKPKMTINATKTSGIARSRHQLSTMLKEAYENREALEERIAEGRRNRKEAGNKYGF